MKKLFLTTTLFALLLIGADAQNSGTHTLGIQISRYYSDTGHPGAQTRLALELDKGFVQGHYTGGEPDLAYALSFTHGYRISPWFKWESSIGFSTINYKFDGEVTLRNEDRLLNSDVEIWDLVKSVEGNNYIYFLELQMGPQFSIGSQRIRVFLKPFGEVNYYLNNRRREKITYEDGYVIDQVTSRDTTTQFHNVYPAAGLATGIEARVSKRVEVALMLMGEIYFRPVDDLDISSDNYPYAGGASLRISYRL
jgi:hypothetical protein